MASVHALLGAPEVDLERAGEVVAEHCDERSLWQFTPLPSVPGPPGPFLVLSLSVCVCVVLGSV